ncbi:MAG: hypothetical protein K0R47_480 [Brevibacillus sp.]|nr:hypothetical protein [Brevibacillus sp.]
MCGSLPICVAGKPGFLLSTPQILYNFPIDKGVFAREYGRCPILLVD